MSSKESSAIKGTREYREKIEGAAKWLGESHTREDKNSFRILNEIFDESLVVLEFQEELESLILKPEGDVFKKFLDIDIKSNLSELKEDKSKGSLRGIFERLENKINKFYSLTLEDHDLTPDEKGFKRRWKRVLEQHDI